jgi:hypothetical protein
MKYIENNIIPIIFSAFVILILVLSLSLTELSYKYLTLSALIGFMVILFFLTFEILDIVYLLRNFQIFLIFLNFLIQVFLFTAIPIVLAIPTGGVRTVAFVFMLISIFIISDSNRLKIKLHNNIWERLFLYPLIITFFISTLIFNTSDYLDIYGGPALLTFIISPFVLFYYFPRRMIDEPKIYSLFLMLIFIIGFTGAVFGIITVIFPGTNPINTLPGYAISFFQHPNANAFLYGYSTPVTFYLFLKYKDKLGSSKRSLLLSALILMIISQLLTLSRSGNIAMIFSILIFLLFYSRKLSLAFIVIMPMIIYFLFQFTTEKGAATLLGRVGLLFSAFEMMNSSKTGTLWGFGISSYSPIYETFKSSLWVSDVHNYPHNSIVYTILRFGAVNTFFLISYITVQLVIAFKGLFLRRMSLEYVLCLSVCTTVLVQSLLEDFIGFPEYYLFHFFLVFFGLLVFYNKTRKVSIKL